ncbi:MAG: hypothetical protein ACFFAY_06185 [Promethearchaeota archaeon]
MTPGADNRDWLKPFIILVILGLIVCNPAFQLSWANNPIALDSAVSAQDGVSYEVTGRFAGSPSTVLPFGEYLIVAIADQLELRDSTYGLISSIQLPFFATDAAITDYGDVVVALLYHGLVLVDIDEAGSLKILDQYGSRTWTELKCGADFFLATPSDSPETSIFDVSQERIIHERVLNEGYDPSRSWFSCDAESHIVVWTEGGRFHIHDRLLNETIVIRDNYIGSIFWLDLEDNRIIYTGHNLEFNSEIAIIDVSQLFLSGEVELYLRLFCLGGWSLFHSLNFMYLRTYSGAACSQSPYLGYIAINKSNSTDIRILDNDLIESTRYSPQFASNDNILAITGLNYVQICSIDGFEPESVNIIEFPGYITDLTSAYGIFDVAVWPAYEIDQQPAERTWGYPFVDPDLFPIVGDLADVNTAGGHLFYRDYRAIRSLVNPRMEHHSLPTYSLYYGIHPAAELSEYNGNLYNFLLSASYGYQLYVFDPGTYYDPESESVVGQLLHEASLTPSLVYMRTMQDDLYIAGSPSRLFTMNVTSLEYGISQVSLPADSTMLQGYQDKLFVLSEVITCYEKNGSWPLNPSLIYLSELDIDADVFTIVDNLVYAANSTHVHVISLEPSGNMHLIDSIEAPTNILQTFPWDPEAFETMFVEVGDLHIDPVSGAICRAAGTYGIWTIERIEHTEPPTTTTTTTTSTTTTTTTIIEPMNFLEATVRFSAGFGISLASILAVTVVLQRIRRSS